MIRKTKLVYSNGPSQVHFSCPFKDGSKRTANKTCLKLSKTEKAGAVASIAERQKQLNKQGTKKANIIARAVEQTQINPKYNKNITLITSLLEQYEVPKNKIKWEMSRDNKSAS